MTAFVIFDVEIRDAVRYQEFMDRVKPALIEAGAKYLARGGALKVYEGTGSPGASSFCSFPRSRPSRPSMRGQPTRR